jgi:hypothetical protein
VALVDAVVGINLRNLSHAMVWLQNALGSEDILDLIIIIASILASQERY